MPFLGGQGGKAFLLLSACRGVKGAPYRRWLVPRHCSKCLQHPYPAPLGRKRRLKAASVAKRLEPSEVQGWIQTVLVSIPGSPLCASVDCCLIYKNGKIIWSPPLSTPKSARERKKRTRYNPQKVKNVASAWVSPCEYPYPPGYLGLSYFIVDMKKQFVTFLWAPSPEAVIPLTQQTSSYEQTSQTAGASSYMVGWSIKKKKKEEKHNAVQHPSHGNQRKAKKKPHTPFSVHFTWRLRSAILWFHKLLNLPPL